MSEFRVASRYAKSLLDLSKEKGQLESVRADMAYFTEVCDQNKDFLLMLKSPIIPSDKKLKIIYQVFSDRVNPITLLIFDLTVNKRREDLLYAVSKEFVVQYNQLNNIKKAQLITATNLNYDLRSKVETLAAKIANTQVVLETNVDPKIIGGFVLRIGDVQMDESVSSQLKKLKSSFSNNPFESKF